MKKQDKGQGVIEYAGAMVVAVVMITIVMTGGVSSISTLFDDITGLATTFITGEAAALGSSETP